MPSPFPGMDPYLEAPWGWPDVHHELMSTIRGMLIPQVRPKYAVRIEERVYISGEDDPGRRFIIPDVRVFANPRGRGPMNPSDLEPSRPLVAVTMVEDEVEVREKRLAVVDRESQAVVTVIEVLSPTNKLPGADGREAYREKRNELMHSPSHLVEIDLLREGRRWVELPQTESCDYLVHVSRAHDRPNGQLWPIQLTEKLPAIPIPLRQADEDARINLQAALDEAYDRAGYDMTARYDREPTPPLTPAQRKWSDELLKSKNVR